MVKKKLDQDSRLERFSVGKVVAFSLTAIVVPLLLMEGVSRLWLGYAPRSMIEATVAGRAVHTNAFHELFGDLDLQDARTAAELYQQDAELFWTLTPNTSLQPENIVYVTRDKEPIRWSLEINASGHRGPRYPDSSEITDPVIACFGDSCTFGYRVNDHETYPVQLESYLQEHGRQGARVVNFGVPGYTTFQGKRRLAQVLDRHSPDIVILAFGANDHEQDIYSDREKAERIHPAGISVSRALDHVAMAKVFSGLIQYQAEPAYSRNLPARVSEKDYRDNLQAMVSMAQKAGCRVILLDMVFFAPLHQESITQVARKTGVETINCRELLHEIAIEMLEGKRFQKQRAELDHFWDTEVASYRQVYYSAQHYRHMFQNRLWRSLLRYLLIEPVHPSTLGYQIISQTIAEKIMRSDTPVKPVSSSP